MRECVMITTNVNSGGTFAMMNEGQALIMMIVICVVGGMLVYAHYDIKGIVNG